MTQASNQDDLNQSAIGNIPVYGASNLDPNTERLLRASNVDGIIFRSTHFYARNENGDEVQARFVLIDQFDSRYFCDLRNGITVERVEDDAKFDDSMTQSGFAQIGDQIMGIGLFALQPVNLLSFLEEKMRNFAVNGSVEFVFDFISDLLHIGRWQTSDGLKWFLKGMVVNAAGNNIAANANQNNNVRFRPRVQIRRQLEQIRAIRVCTENEPNQQQFFTPSMANHLCAGFLRNEGCGGAVDALTSVVFPLCGLHDLENGTKFEDLNVYARLRKDESVDVRITLIDQWYYPKYVCRQFGVNISHIMDDDKFDGDMEDEGCIKVESEELGLVMPDCDAADALRIIERARGQCASRSVQFLYNVIRSLNISIGIASCDELKELLKRIITRNGQR